MKSFIRKISDFLLSSQSAQKRNKKAFTREITKDEILNFSLKYGTPEINSDKESLEKILTKIDSTVTFNSNVKERKIQYKYFYAAASVLILLGTVFVFSNLHSTKVITSPGQQVSIYLPDSSEAIINSSSQLVYNSKEWKTRRIVKLEGEAFFRVKKGGQFEVHTKKCITSVLGTSFNVFARGNNFRVSCFTGKVSVKLKKKESRGQIITAGFETRISGNKSLSEPYTFDSQSASMWQKGEFYYNNEPLENVFEEMERQFNIKIKTKDISDRTFTGYFFRNNLQQALKLVCEPMQLEYELEGKTIVIKYKLIK